MISRFGVCVKALREKHHDTLKTLSQKLNISLPYLSAMEVGRRLVPIDIIKKIKEIYNLTEKEYDDLFIATMETNQHVDLELSKMGEAQREVSMAFARKIENADPKLIEKLRKALATDEEDESVER